MVVWLEIPSSTFDASYRYRKANDQHYMEQQTTNIIKFIHDYDFSSAQGTLS